MTHIEFSINLPDSEAESTILTLLGDLDLKFKHAPESNEWTLIDGDGDDTPHDVGKIIVSPHWQPAATDALKEINKAVLDVAERNNIQERDRIVNFWLVRHVLSEMESRANNTIENVGVFIDEAIVFLRAIEMMAGGVVEGGSKGDINARARGLIDMVRNVTEQVARMRDSFQWVNWRASFQYDPWRKDFAKRELVDTLRTVIEENKQFRERLGEGKADHEQGLEDKWHGNGFRSRNRF